MSKRFAGSQITREGLENREHDDASDEDTGMQKPSVASDVVMSKRKIAMPKRKMGGLNTGTKPSMFGNAATTAVGAAATLEGGSETNEKITALNLKFREKVVSTLQADPVADLSELFEKYRTYLQDLKSKKTSASQENGLQAVKPPKSSFTFGSVSGSQSQVAGTPSFGNVSSTDKPKSAFGFNTAATAFGSAAPPNGSKPADNDQIEIDSNSDAEAEVPATKNKVDPPAFVLTKTPTTSDPPFTFNKKRQNDSDESDHEKKEKGPQFTFTGTVSSATFKLPKADKPSDDQGTKSEPEEKKDAPASIFGNSNSEKKPIFGGFGSSSTEPTQASKPTFGGFSSTSASDTSKNVPSFSFSNNETQLKNTNSAFKGFCADTTSANKIESKTPSFSFSAQTANAEGKDSSKPSFTFGSTPATTAPSFTFGKQEVEKSDEKKPTFTFGASSASNVPSFSFDTKNSTEKEGQTASSGFKFSLPFAPNNASTDKSSKKEEQELTGEESKNADETTDEASKPLVLSNGEENEDLLFSQRAKLMVFNTETKSYDSRGVGELKLLQNKEDKTKCRILCRSDGMGHILLNTSIVKSFTYDALDPNSENLVRCPVVNAEGGLDTFVLKVKQKADGRKLVQAIKDAKQSM